MDFTVFVDWLPAPEVPQRLFEVVPGEVGVWEVVG